MRAGNLAEVYQFQNGWRRRQHSRTDHSPGHGYDLAVTAFGSGRVHLGVDHVESTASDLIRTPKQKRPEWWPLRHAWHVFHAHRGNEFNVRKLDVMCES